MKSIDIILEHTSIVPYLHARNLISQYKKAKHYLLAGKTHLVNFKLRKPKKDQIYYFRINNQYRAFAFLEKGVLKVFKISDHQNG